MIKRRLFALAMTAVLALSSSVVAFAESNVNLSASTGLYSSSEIGASGETKTPTITITVPTSSEFIINPYKLTVSGLSNVPTGLASLAIVSPEYTIDASSCNVAVTVSATLKKAEIGYNTSIQSNVEKLTLASADLTGKETAKTAFIFVDFSTTPHNAEVKYLSTDSADVKAKRIILSTGDKTQTVGTIAAGGSMYYEFFGSACANPKQAWNEKDTVKTSIKFTFTPTVTN